MQSSTILVLCALAAGAAANPIGLGNWGGIIVGGGPNSSPAAVAAARAAHLAEVARITNDRLSALAAANAGAGAGIGQVVVQAAPQPIQDNADVAIARAAHLAEVSRQNGAALSALAAAQARASVGVVGLGQVVGARGITIADAPDVALARAAHLAEVARITNSRLGALSAANGGILALGGVGKIYG